MKEEEGTYLREVFLFDIMAKGKGTYQTAGTYSRKYGLWKIIIFVNFELRDKNTFNSLLLFRDVKDGVHKQKGWSNSGEILWSHAVFSFVLLDILHLV